MHLLWRFHGTINVWEPAKVLALCSHLNARRPTTPRSVLPPLIHPCWVAFTSLECLLVRVPVPSGFGQDEGELLCPRPPRLEFHHHPGKRWPSRRSRLHCTRSAHGHTLEKDPRGWREAIGHALLEVSGPWTEELGWTRHWSNGITARNRQATFSNDSALHHSYSANLSRRWTPLGRILWFNNAVQESLRCIPQSYIRRKTDSASSEPSWTLEVTWKSIPAIKDRANPALGAWSYNSARISNLPVSPIVLIGTSQSGLQTYASCRTLPTESSDPSTARARGSS